MAEWQLFILNMPRFTEKDRSHLMSLKDKRKALAATMILDKFDQKLDECPNDQSITSIVNSTENAIKMLYAAKPYKTKVTIKILGVISKETLRDRKNKIIVRKEQRITKLIIKKLQDNNFEEILVEEDEDIDIHKVMEVMISHIAQLLPENKKKNMNKSSKNITFTNILNTFLEDETAYSTSTSNGT